MKVEDYKLATPQMGTHVRQQENMVRQRMQNNSHDNKLQWIFVTGSDARNKWRQMSLTDIKEERNAKKRAVFKNFNQNIMKN